VERVVNSESVVELRNYEKSQLKQVSVISGISPNAMRRVFGGWILFAALVGIIVSVAPDLDSQFIGLTLFVLVAFTVVMFWQSRISEGWPAIICDDDYIGVVRDPVLREYVCVKKSIITDAQPSLIKPNKKAVEMSLDTSALSETDTAILKQAVWPREDKLIGLAHFKRREEACESVMWCVNHNTKAVRSVPIRRVPT